MVHFECMVCFKFVGNKGAREDTMFVRVWCCKIFVNLCYICILCHIQDIIFTLSVKTIIFFLLILFAYHIEIENIV